MATRILRPTDLTFGAGHSTPVVSNAQKFVIPVPALGRDGEPLVYPSEHPKAGQPIVDYEGKPVGERGIVFFNAEDNAWQAAAGDGTSVIIINEVTSEQAAALTAKQHALQPDPADLNRSDLKALLTFAQEQLGLNDVYNSTRTYVQENMVPIGTKSATERYGSMAKRTDTLSQAVYVAGAFAFEGPTTTHQLFADGGVIVEKNGNLHGVQPEVFQRTYQHADGQPIKSLTDIQAQG